MASLNSRLDSKTKSRRHTTTSFSQVSFGENVVVVKEKYWNVSIFIILRSRKGLTDFNKNNRANVAAKKKSKIKISKDI